MQQIHKLKSETGKMHSKHQLHQQMLKPRKTAQFFENQMGPKTKQQQHKKQYQANDHQPRTH